MTKSNHKPGCWHYHFDVLPVIVIQRGNERRVISKEIWDGTLVKEDPRFKTKQQRLREEVWLPTNDDPRTVRACTCAEIGSPLKVPSWTQ